MLTESKNENIYETFLFKQNTNITLDDEVHLRLSVATAAQTLPIWNRTDPETMFHMQHML